MRTPKSFADILRDWELLLEAANDNAEPLAAAQPGPYDALPQVFRNNVDRATTAGTRMAMPRIPVQQGGGATPPPHP